MLDTIYLLKNGSIQENYRKLYVLDRSHVGNLLSIGEGVVIVLYVLDGVNRCTLAGLG
jgi:hypothetical protein